MKMYEVRVIEYDLDSWDYRYANKEAAIEKAIMEAEEVLEDNKNFFKEGLGAIKVVEVVLPERVLDFDRRSLVACIETDEDLEELKKQLKEIKEGI